MRTMKMSSGVILKSEKIIDLVADQMTNNGKIKKGEDKKMKRNIATKTLLEHFMINSITFHFSKGVRSEIELQRWTDCRHDILYNYQFVTNKHTKIVSMYPTKNMD